MLFAIVDKIDFFHHVKDKAYIEFFETVNTKIPLPTIFGIQITFFMLLELVAALLMMAIFIPLARTLRTGEPPRGIIANAFESLLLFIRDDVAKTGIGEHDYERYTPFLWTLFFYILFCNLLGMIPFLASPTGHIMVTGALALCAFMLIHGVPIYQMGPFRYLKTFIPPLDMGDNPVMKAFGYVIMTAMFFIELFSGLMRGVILAIRLFANMLAGHTLLAVILAFIVMAKNLSLFFWVPLTAGSVVATLMLSLLELFVAFLQAFVFTLLTSLYIGMALHPEH